MIEDEWEWREIKNRRDDKSKSIWNYKREDEREKIVEMDNTITEKN